MTALAGRLGGTPPGCSAAPAPRRGDRGGRGLSLVRRGAAAIVALPLVCAVALTCAWPSRAAATNPPARSSVVLAFLPAQEPELASVPGMSVGIMSATQGSYSAEQLLLDITQGARIASSAYSPTRPPPLALQIRPRAGGGRGARRGRGGRRAEARRRRRRSCCARRTARRSSFPAAAEAQAEAHTRGSREPTTPTRSPPPIVAAGSPRSRSGPRPRCSHA